MSKTLLFVNDLATAKGPQPKKGSAAEYCMPIPTDLVSEDFSSDKAECLWAQVKQFVKEPADQKALAALIKSKFGLKPDEKFGNPQWTPAFAWYKKLTTASKPIIQNDQQMRHFAGVSWTLILLEAAANNLVDWKTLEGNELFNNIEVEITNILFPEDTATDVAEPVEE